MSKELYKLQIKYRMFVVAENTVSTSRRISPFFMFDFISNIFSQIFFQVSSEILGDLFIFVLIEVQPM